jgi:tRNA(Ser,Leu) C12 N-acetylase TAN1
MVHNQVRLNEVSGEINEMNTKLAVEANKSITLTSELESIANLDVIEEQAKEVLGMHRLDTRQIERIDLQKEDEIRLTEDSPNVSLGEKIEMAVKSAISSIQEYLGE